MCSTPRLLAAQVQKPAPVFKAQAVVDGQFKEVSLADYQVDILDDDDGCLNIVLLGEVCGGLLLSSRLHIRLSHRDHRLL